MRTFVVYKTGDQVWFGRRYGREKVIKMISHDGLVWSEEEPVILPRLSGIELYVHKVQVALTRFILKMLTR